jgi:recombination protein RecT
MTETAIAKKSEELKFAELLQQRLHQFPQLMARYMTPEKVAQLALMAVLKTPGLRECSALSILNGFITCAKLGIDPTRGNTALVPFKNKYSGHKEAVLIIGYDALIDLATRDGRIEAIMPYLVYRGDEFGQDFGEQILTHKPTHTAEQETDDNIICAYAIAWLKSGRRLWKYVSRKEIEKTRSQSRAKDDGPWVTHFPQMCLKTAVRRLISYLPRNPELAEAMEIESRSESGGTYPISDIDILLPASEPPVDALAPGRHQPEKNGKEEKKFDPDEFGPGGYAPPPDSKPETPPVAPPESPHPSDKLCDLNDRAPLSEYLLLQDQSFLAEGAKEPFELIFNIAVDWQTQKSRTTAQRFQEICLGAGADDKLSLAGQTALVLQTIANQLMVETKPKKSSGKLL